MLLLIIAALACPIGMGAMMWWMSRNMGGQQGGSQAAHTSETAHLHALREQRRLLEQEIAETERIAALEAQRQALERSQNAAPDGRPQPVESARD